MLVDFRTTESDADFSYDLCIVGPGPAGISLAREFAGSNVKVCLVESGSTEPDDNTQKLYEGEVTGFKHTALDACRLRYLGGSSNCWNGWCAPFDAIDFDKKPWVPHSGWPIQLDDLMSFYARAGIVCEVGDRDYGDWFWNKFKLEKPGFDEEKVKVCQWRKSPPTRFGERYGAELKQADNITVLLNANAVELETSSNGKEISGLNVASLTGRNAKINSRHFVLACGGIENPRLLLASDNHNARGLGNAYDQVGRYFMEHPYATSALAYSRPVDFHPDVEKKYGSVPVELGFCIAPAEQRKDTWLDAVD